MLVLTRKLNEKIHIGDSIELVVLSIDKGRVRLGIAAPSDVPVHRGEIYERIKDDKNTGDDLPPVLSIG
jgi:carbon storage regulator